MSKSTKKPKGQVGGNPMPGLLSLWPSSTGFEGAGRGRRGLASPCAGAGQRGCRQRGRSERDAIHSASLSPPLHPRCSCPRQPRVVAGLGLLLVPCSPSLLPSRHRTRHPSKHSPRSWHSGIGTGEPEGAQPVHPMARGSAPSRSTPAQPRFI